MFWPARWSWVTLVILTLACLATPAISEVLWRQPIPTLVVNLGYDGTVLSVGTPAPTDPPPRSKSDPPKLRSTTTTLEIARPRLECSGGPVLLNMQDGAHNPFCVTASKDALAVNFLSPRALSYVSPKAITCTPLKGAKSNDTLTSVVARVGRSRTPSDAVAYDGARAQCDFDAGFGYAFAVEQQSGSKGVPAGAKDVTRTLSIPWKLLHLDDNSRAILLKAGGYAFQIPLQINTESGSMSTDYAPLSKVNTATGSAQSSRTHDVELNFAFALPHHKLVASFNQSQATNSVNRALSNASSLAPVQIGSAQRMPIGSDLQSQSQALFTFLQPSDLLEDPAMKGLFDSTPFSVNKLSALSAGYAYGFTSQYVNAAGFYGLQSPGTYNAGATATFILPTPTPSPEPQQLGAQVTGNEATPHEMLHPPQPPAPYFESGTQSTPPFELAISNASSASKGSRDSLDALAFEGHLYNNQSHSGSDYFAQTFNVFGRLEHDFRRPLGTMPGSISQFLGQSATFTSGTGDGRGNFFQVRETLGAQLNDRFFTPTSGSATWLAPLSGPVAHVTLSLASGPQARYYALDLLGFRLTNVAGDFAAQEGWQMTIPFALGTRSWQLSSGSLTQTVSDRLAAINQGLISSYAQATTQVPSLAKRPQRLANISFLSPKLNLGDKWDYSIAGGFNTGTVTACGAASTGRNPAYQCLTVFDSRTVGGVALDYGKLSFGATDTAIQSGNLSSGAAARNFGSSGGLPGTVTAYLNFSGCPQISAAYANAAMVSGTPFPQQGSTLGSQLDWPIAFGHQKADIILGYFNERALINPSFNDSGFSAVLRLGTSFNSVARCSNSPFFK